LKVVTFKLQAIDSVLNSRVQIIDCVTEKEKRGRENVKEQS
jgi:hypothetical protein